MKKKEKRSKSFLEVAFYLSKFGTISEADKYPLPPARLNVNRWNQAYRIFYENLNGGRAIIAFGNSLNNARDAFDSHLPDSKRIGWLSNNKKPNPLGKDAQIIFDELISKSEKEVWDIVKPYSDLNIKNYKEIFEDLIGFQESESEYKKSNRCRHVL